MDYWKTITKGKNSTLKGTLLIEFEIRFQFVFLHAKNNTKCQDKLN